MSDSGEPVEQEVKRMIGCSWIFCCIYLLFFYIGTYAVVRVLFTQEHKTLLVGPEYTETVFDQDYRYQEILYYAYWPLGYCDYTFTEQFYVLKKPLLDKLKDTFE